MKRHLLLALSLIMFCSPGILYSEALPALVSASWLNDNLKSPNLLVLDIRKIEDYREGHIPGVMNLPFSLVFHKDGSLTNPDALRHIAQHSVGDDLDKRIVVLCCNGQFASSWWFAFSEMLGYRDVRIYDGSMEEWCKDGDTPLVESECYPVACYGVTLFPLPSRERAG